ncbi:extracellular metalloprotease-4 [Elsinoe australis]|uniref:Extracellular metalloprotease-4 n=1 Tax=Elsinoe australis TaxID=40998 RepID=A0A2P8ADR0_9PEZI|nr:hypothetical protein B9Z65_6615 [Elsinoe australis]TKX20842.1 extracellular metalloprotease-4 [Elsinoe australis]
MKSFISILALAAAASAEYIRCATEQPPAEILRPVEINRQLLESINSSIAAVSVPTYVHVVTTSATASQYNQAIVNRQIDVLNDRYAQAGISFTLAGTDFTVNSAWAAATQGSTAERQMKTSLRRGDYGTLNLYFLSNLGGGLLGWCTFPSASAALVNDGCVNLASSMPGGSATNFNLGLTAVHEVGHWFGAYHVFQGSACSGSGDFVSDTPIQSTATSGCPVGKDSCPGVAGVDSIRNYMDYSYDSCMNTFSAGQISRMNSLYAQYRA